MLESCLATFANVLFHAKTGECNSQNGPVRLHPSDQIDSAAIGQPEVANEYIELILRYQIECRLNVARRLHMIATEPK